MGLYEVENIDNPNVCAIVVNPKEYFEKFRNKSINKKHKGVRKDTKGMCFEAYISRILEIDKKPKQNKKTIQKRFQVKNIEMKITTVNKVQFASLNNKRYHCPDGITPLSYGHPLLLELRKRKKAFPKVQKLIKEEKNNLLKEELNAIRKHERINTSRTILSQPILLITKAIIK